MNDVPPSATLAAALAAAQGELRDPKRTKTGMVKGRTGYRYASIDDLLIAVRPVLSKHGLAVTQTIEATDTGPVLCTTLWHATGGRIDSRYPLGWQGGPQEHGSELSYARRYSLEALVGVAATPDDDAATATERTRPSPSPSPSPPAAGGAHRQQSTSAVSASGEGKVWAGAEAAAFQSALAERDLDYQSVCDMVEKLKNVRPSGMSAPDRSKVLEWLDTEKGRDAYTAAVAERDNLLEKARRLSVPERKRAAEKARVGTEPAKLSAVQLRALLAADAAAMAVA